MLWFSLSLVMFAVSAVAGDFVRVPQMDFQDVEAYEDRSDRLWFVIKGKYKLMQGSHFATTELCRARGLRAPTVREWSSLHNQFTSNRGYFEAPSTLKGRTFWLNEGWGGFFGWWTRIFHGDTGTFINVQYHHWVVDTLEGQSYEWSDTREIACLSQVRAEDVEEGCCWCPRASVELDDGARLRSGN